MKKAIKVLLISLAAATLLSACASPPDAELTAAKGAVDAVVSEGAEQYIPEKLHSLNVRFEEALTEIKNQDRVFFKNYSLAKFTLEQVKTDADALKGTLAQRKEELKVAAGTALSEARGAVTEARRLLEMAPQGKGSLADIEAMKNDVVGLETELEGVQPQIDSGEYIAATEKAHAVTSQALGISSDITQAQEKLAQLKK
jgi:hypothetical protein